MNLIDFFSPKTNSEKKALKKTNSSDWALTNKIPVLN